MAGEILTSGLSVLSLEDGYTFGIGLNAYLTYANAARVVGSLLLEVKLDFVLAQSNKMRIRVYRKNLGTTYWGLNAKEDLDSTDGTTKTFTYYQNAIAAWLIIIEPLRYNVRTVRCHIHIDSDNAVTNYANSGKLLRICNNPQVDAHAFAYPFDITVSELNGYETFGVTTSVGTLLQDGQWIFGRD